MHAHAGVPQHRTPPQLAIVASGDEGGQAFAEESVYYYEIGKPGERHCHGLAGRAVQPELCAHVVQQREEMIVPDTLQDDRFADNPLVVDEPRIRFYAGAPLILDDGNCIGTHCVVDTRPRELSAAEFATLRDLRDLVVEEIKRKQA